MKSTVRWVKGLPLALLVTIALSCSHYRHHTASTAGYPADWNLEKITWWPYGAGLTQAKKTKKPIVLVFFVDWCPHCHHYSRVFHDPALVDAAQSFVMIRVDRDLNRDISQQYALDGDYIPRTFFLYSDGEPMRELHTGRDEYRYFLDEYEPGETLELMARAKARADARSGPE
jgi:thioredoxin-like negative regulator of GroEL